MKWNKKSPPKHLEERVVKKFALFPTAIQSQWVWLERYESHQTYWGYPLYTWLEDFRKAA